MHILGMSNLDDQPSDDVIESAETLWTETAEERKSVLMRISKKVVEEFVNILFNSQAEKIGLVMKYTTAVHIC